MSSELHQFTGKTACLILLKFYTNAFCSCGCILILCVWNADSFLVTCFAFSISLDNTRLFWNDFHPSLQSKIFQLNCWDLNGCRSHSNTLPLKTRFPCRITGKCICSVLFIHSFFIFLYLIPFFHLNWNGSVYELRVSFNGSITTAAGVLAGVGTPFLPINRNHFMNGNCFAYCLNNVFESIYF